MLALIRACSICLYTGRGMSSAGSRLVSLDTIDQTETGRRWLIMLLFALTILDNDNYTFLLNKGKYTARVLLYKDRQISI